MKCNIAVITAQTACTTLYDRELIAALEWAITPLERRLCDVAYALSDELTRVEKGLALADDPPS